MSGSILNHSVDLIPHIRLIVNMMGINSDEHLIHNMFSVIVVKIIIMIFLK